MNEKYASTMRIYIKPRKETGTVFECNLRDFNNFITCHFQYGNKIQNHRSTQSIKNNNKRASFFILSLLKLLLLLRPKIKTIS